MFLQNFIIFTTFILIVPLSEGYRPKSRVGNRPRNVQTSTSTTTTTTTVAPETTTTPYSKQNKIPTNLLIKLGKETDLAQFFLKYVENTWIQRDNKTNQEYWVNSQGQPILVGNSEKLVIITNQTITSNTSSQPVPWKPGRSGNRPGSSSQNNTTPNNFDNQFSVCFPQNRTVHVTFPNLGPSYAIVPSCVSVPRCGGCCILGADMLICEPKETVFVNHTIRILEYSGYLMPFREVGHEQFQVEEHTRCTCNCRVTKGESLEMNKKDCQSVHHLYSESKCACECQNVEAKETCDNFVDENGNSLRFWDEDSCTCKCHDDDRKECSSGYKFDEDDTCNCILDEAI